MRVPGLHSRPGGTAAGGGGKKKAVVDDRHEQGRAIYNFRCYFCHGYSGDARTLAASYLQPRPRSFIDTDPASLSRDAMLKVVTDGKPGTAMKGFGKVLDRAEINLVVDFVRREFMELKRRNTRYHTEENGWPDHQRYRLAFPFALGEIPIDTPLEQLSPEQRLGWRLFMDSCISCHDRARVRDEGSIWDARPLSFPRGGYDHRTGTRPQADGISGASPYAIHDRAPELSRLTPRQRQGETLYQNNCAFCHAADGSGRNWIGSFLAAPPRDLRSAQVREMTDQALMQTVREGLPGTTMSAWKHVLEDDQIRAIIDYIRVAFGTGPHRQ